jgi:hypothetical protein
MCAGGGMWSSILIGMSSIQVGSVSVSFLPTQSIAPIAIPVAFIFAAFRILLSKAAPLYFTRRNGNESLTMKSICMY